MRPSGGRTSSMSSSGLEVNRPSLYGSKSSHIIPSPHQTILRVSKPIQTSVSPPFFPPLPRKYPKQELLTRHVFLEILLVIDSLNPPSSPSSSSCIPLPLFLSSLVASPTISLVSLYHLDLPSFDPPQNPYEPDPLTVLAHLATAILRVSSLAQDVARRRARDRSLPEPEWGLREGREGVLMGLKRAALGLGDVGGGKNNTNGDGDHRAISGNNTPAWLDDSLVLEMELRRRSGRAVIESFVLSVPPSSSLPSRADSQTETAATQPPIPTAISKITILSDHPAFIRPEDVNDTTPSHQHSHDVAAGHDDETPSSTFSLGLTDKQRRDRENIVLPYFDAQTDIGAGEGGRILYEMGREDDFDDEEDEI